MNAPRPTRPTMLAADHINELTRPYTTTERIHRPTQDTTAGTWRTTWQLHTVTHPPLLAQLEEAVTTATLGNEDTFRSVPRSKPSARLDALAVLERIERQSSDLADDLDIRLCPLRTRLSRISGKIGDTQNRTVAGWWTAARIATGWESPPYTPNGVPCPVEECEQRGGLRIRLSEHIGYCTECGAHWAPTEIGMLGQWVAWAAEHLIGPRHWLHDQEGELIECVECLATRDAMAERAFVRARVRDTRVERAS